MTPADSLLDTLARDRLDLHPQDGGLKAERAYYEWRASLGSVGVPQETAPLEARAEGAWPDAGRPGIPEHPEHSG